MGPGGWDAARSVPRMGPNPGAAVTVAQGQDGNGLAVTSSVLGITCIVFCWWGLFTLAQVVLAIVFGGTGKQGEQTGNTAQGPRGRWARPRDGRPASTSCSACFRWGSAGSSETVACSG